MRLTTALVLLLGIVFSPVPADEPPVKKDRTGEIERLIADLDSNEFEVRNGATQKLIAVDEEALPALRKALQAKPSLEVLRRLEVIIDRIEQKTLERRIERMVAKVNESSIDQLIDLMVRGKDLGGDKAWAAALRKAQAIAERSSEFAARKMTLPPVDYLQYPVGELPTTDNLCELRVLTSGALPPHRWPRNLTNAFIISAGPSQRRQDIGSLNRCILFINGDFAGCSTISHSVIFCNGDVGPASVHDSIVIATGRIIGTGPDSGATIAERSLFQAGNGVGGHAVSIDNTYLNQKEVNAPKQQNNRFVETTRGPLPMLRLFDLAQEGLEVKMSDGGVTVDKVIEGKPFARAGLRQGDVIAALDGTAVAAVEDLRRLLRRKLPKEKAVFKVRRGAQEIAVMVEF